MWKSRKHSQTQTQEKQIGSEAIDESAGISGDGTHCVHRDPEDGADGEARTQHQTRRVSRACQDDTKHNLPTENGSCSPDGRF